MKSTKCTTLTALLLAFLFMISAGAPIHSTHATVPTYTHSSNVAYVTDASGSYYDSGLAGSNIFGNAVDYDGSHDCLPTQTSPCTYTTSGGNTVTLTDVPATSVTGVSSFAGYDTVMLYEVCDIGTQTTLVSALNTFLTNGGKVIIFDGDWCAPEDGGAPDYSGFLYPFTTSNPGPMGSDHTLTFVESESLPATVTRGLAVGDGGAGGLGGFNDAIGDSNTFVTYNPAWCVALEGPNANGVTGAQVAYARTSAGGLALYDGEDNAVTFGPNIYQKTVFDNLLDQPWNPDSLPCNVVATGITLTPSTATNPVGSTHTLTATVLDSTGAPVSEVTVTFTVLAGPNAGTTGTGTTNSAGQATWTYSDEGGSGTDTIQASFTDMSLVVHDSNTVQKIWSTSSTTTTTTSTSTSGPPIGAPEFAGPSILVVAITLLGLAFLAKKKSSLSSKAS